MSDSDRGRRLELTSQRGNSGAMRAGLTSATGLALANARLAAVGRARMAEVQASQRRIVSTVDSERLRIERDLHDVSSNGWSAWRSTRGWP